MRILNVRRQFTKSETEFILDYPHFKELRVLELKEKLAPHFVGPYRILQRMGEVAYKLELPEDYQEFMMYSMFLS